MRYLCPVERAGVIQKLTILEHKNGLVLANTRVPVSGTWSILFPNFTILRYSYGSISRPAEPIPGSQQQVCLQWRHQKFFVEGHRGSKMHFWGGKKSKNLPKLADFDIFFLLTGEASGGRAEPPTGGANAPCPPWCRHCLFVLIWIHFHPKFIQIWQWEFE